MGGSWPRGIAPMSSRWQRLLEHPMWNRPFFDIVMVMVWVVAALVAVFWAAEGSVYRLMAGLPLALYLPGYTLTAALFANRPLDRATRALLSVACSLLLTVLSGLLLNTLPWGLQPATWALALGLICWIGGTVAVARRAQHPAPGEMPSVAAMQSGPFGLRPAHMLLIGIAVLGALGACWWSIQSALTAPFVGTTQVWLVPVPDSHTAAVNRVQIGLRNLEGQPMTYRLQLLVDGAILSEWPAITLQDGEAADSYYPLPAAGRANERVEALLYRADDPLQVYRRAVIWRSPAAATPTLPLRPTLTTTPSPVGTS
jgi:hypothetical protein